jgi:DNA-binding transcriptional regulator YiaG
MNSNKNIEPSLLKTLLSYNDESGLIFWKERGQSHFTSPARCKTWNTKYAGKIAGSLSRGDGYVHITIFGKQYMAHRVAWVLHHGSWPLQYIDHIDHRKDNNRIANLRDVSPSDNVRNKDKSGYMAASEFARVRMQLGLSFDNMAKALGLKSSRAVRYYESGERCINGLMAELVRRLPADKETGK